MGAVKDAVDVGLSVVLEVGKEVPGLGGLLRLYDTWAADARIGKLEADVQAMLEVIGRDGGTLDVAIGKAIQAALADGFPDLPQLRKADSCLVIMRAFSQRSQLGWERDPVIHRDEAVALISGLLNHPEPVSELRAVVHELKRAELANVLTDGNAPVELPWHSVGPSLEFFPRTDRFFQTWNPANDAREICRHPSTRARRGYDARQLDGELGWNPRRFNPATVYAHRRGWITVPYEMAHDPTYVLPWAYLSEEGEFFLDDEQ